MFSVLTSALHNHCRRVAQPESSRAISTALLFGVGSACVSRFGYLICDYPSVPLVGSLLLACARAQRKVRYGAVAHRATQILLGDQLPAQI